MRPVFLGLASSLVGALGFMLGAHLTFPDDEALERLRYEIEDRSGGEWSVGASDLDLHWLTGVSLDDAIIYKIKKSRLRRRTDDTGTPEVSQWLTADRLAARLQLLPLLRGGQMISFDADLYGGNVNGEVGIVGDEQRLFAEGRAIDLSRVPFAGDDWNLNLTGHLNLDSDLAINKDEIKKSTGSLKISFDQLSLVSGSFSGFNLDKMDFKDATLAFEVDNGVAKVTEGHFASDQLEATISGDITLNKDFKRWRLRLNIVVTFGEELEKLARFVPTLSDARDDEGNYHFIMSGTPGLAKPRPDRLGARGEKAGAPGARLPISDDEGAGPPGPEPPTFEDDPGDGSTAEDRRQRRLERIRKARERRKARESEREEGGADGPMGTGPNMLRPGMGGPDGLGRGPSMGRGPEDRFDGEQGPNGIDDRGSDDELPPGLDDEAPHPDDELDIPEE